MATTNQMDHENELIITTVTGLLDDEDLLAVDLLCRDNPEFKPEYDQLVDLRLAQVQAITRDGVQALANRPPLFIRTSRRAIVVATDMGYGMARMFELMRDSRAGEIRIFREMTEAKAWLGC